MSFAQKTKNVALGQYKYVQPPANMVLQQYKTFYVEPYSNADAAVKVRIRMPNFRHILLKRAIKLKPILQ